MSAYKVYTIMKNHYLYCFTIIVLVILSPVLLNETFFDKHTLAFLVALVLAGFSKNALRVLFIANFLYGLYGLIGISYSYPSFAFFASLIDTNAVESLEFIKNIPITSWFLVSAFLVCNIIYYKSSRYPQCTKRNFIIVCSLFVIALSASWAGKLLRTGYKMPIKYAEHKAFLVNSLNKSDTWEVTKNLKYKKYKNYVLVIGESLRKDYLSVYGYTHNTTDFLSQTNGVFLDNAYSVAASTVASLSRTLQVCDQASCKKTMPENNIISLAKKAGMKTFWVSNQGMIGKHDTATSAVALRADRTFFLRKDRFSDEDTDDMGLVKYVDKILDDNKDSQRDNLIIVHMMGSHPDTCERLHGFEVEFDLPYDKSVNCYLATVSKTDLFIKKLVSSLQSTGEDYSLIYFSDHGVSVEHDRVHHSRSVKNNYQIPFFVINSDDAHQTHIKQSYSNRNFLDLFASWIGVLTNYTSKKYNIFQLDDIPENKNIQVYYEDKMNDVNDLKSELILK